MAKFLPPNVTALIQPMDQGILVAIKHSGGKFWRELLFEDEWSICGAVFEKNRHAENFNYNCSVLDKSL